jgi:hypothetical protein
MKRTLTEFWCDTSGGGCGYYFNTFLRENHSGSYTIECPNCHHHHYRDIQKGVITTNRNYDAQKQKQIIIGLEPVSKIPFHQDPDYKRSLLRRV